MNQVAEEVSRNAESTKASQRVEAGTIMEESQNEMTLMLNAMDEISRASANIGRIIKTIDIGFPDKYFSPPNAAVRRLERERPEKASQ